MKYKIDIDIADYHKIGNGKKNTNGNLELNPYQLESLEIDEQYNHQSIELGFWCVLFSAINIVWRGFLVWWLLVKANPFIFGSYSKIYYFLLFFCLFQIVAYGGLLARQNWSRLFVLSLAYLRLIIFPVGTIEGVIFISRLKNKRFN